MVRQASVKVLQLLEPLVEGLGYEFVGAEYLPQGKHSLLRVYIDLPEDGIGVEDCERVSRQVSSMLDVEDPIPGHYTLEVSSPGMDRPLFTVGQFQRFVGREVKLLLSRPVHKRRKMTVELQGVTDDVVTVMLEGEAIQIDFDNIEKAHLVPVFD
ncbi:ribosome maturation protein RimP [Candidatus Tenderia electrophaga]|jgi:ribosome maturation factor RimP|uniref:Ribosome maturation factor RimP n=1 Tax=Candidatus Tenderia electrophaga TaxID=1748243 RepID=A0A0S2THX5_9GAMM|nr:ribosome maturation protein RimP [Candidatus Tenderia electrophaga]